MILKRMFTFDEFLYVQAEMMQEGLIPGSAGATLTAAMTASFAKVDEVVAGTGTTQTVPTLSGSTAVTDFISDIGGEFTAASAQKQLEIIICQSSYCIY